MYIRSSFTKYLYVEAGIPYQFDRSNIEENNCFYNIIWYITTLLHMYTASSSYNVFTQILPLNLVLWHWFYTNLVEQKIILFQFIHMATLKKEKHPYTRTKKSTVDLVEAKALDEACAEASKDPEKSKEAVTVQNLETILLQANQCRKVVIVAKFFMVMYRQWPKH